MNDSLRCPECGAAWTNSARCVEHFYLMGIWEWEDMPTRGVVHNLMVLCYHLQHPSLYSPDGLRAALQLLVDFVERGVTTEEVRRRDRQALDSGNRRFKIRGTPGAQGSYANSVAWTMTAADVIAAGPDRYVESVRAWARSVLEALKASGNLP